MISRPAIEPAISTRPVKNQLIAKVSRVPRVRQLTALRTDLECVSAPRNKITDALPLSGRGYHVAAAICLWLSCKEGKGAPLRRDLVFGEFPELFDLAS